MKWEIVGRVRGAGERGIMVKRKGSIAGTLNVMCRMLRQIVRTRFSRASYIKLRSLNFICIEGFLYLGGICLGLPAILMDSEGRIGRGGIERGKKVVT